MARIAIPIALAAVVLISAATSPAHRAIARADCTKTSTSFVPLTDLRSGTYDGYRGGLYPGGRVAPSAKYLKQGLAAAKLVKPVDGKIVLLSIGMSNTTQEWQAFMQLARTYAPRNPAVTIVDGAQGGQDAEIVKDAGAPFWANVEQRLAQAGANDAQVQAVWLKEAIARPTEQFPADAQRLRTDLETILRVLAQKFPNLHLVYVSSRTYGGYASTALNPEPYAYQSGFAVKWTVGDRIDGHLKLRPWVGWGPYLWTNGTTARSDGLVWNCADTVADGTHPSDTGRAKVAQLLLKFFTTDPTARTWFPAR
jgi:hypothetical protein